MNLSTRFLTRFFTALLIFSAGQALAEPLPTPHVEIKDNQLFVDGIAQPQLFGAELQYFRLRGGSGKNVPREKVIALWNLALDRMVEARMNTISFYIPWDFHEYAEGKFDFTGTADEDGDGNADYPSRDIFTFFKLIEQHGIHRIMVRPGPFINAEWGFLDFGAVPMWFHEKYPDSHMRNADGLRTKLYDYLNPDLLRYTRLWFRTLHEQVLRHYMGPGKPIIFLQVDNETNYMWQSLFNHDYGPSAVAHYRAFLNARYLTLEELNRTHKTAWRSWQEIRPPRTPGLNVAEDQDWYRFHDLTLHEYLQEIRRAWEAIGVTEPEVLFTLAESYNAAPGGLLPNFELRNDRRRTGMMTVNLYPKTYESPLHPLLNNPFKADHDVKAADEASDAYLGRREEWVFGPEIQGGWWRGIQVTAESRQQTYLSTIGHGLKGLMVYYFMEGDNWQTDWAKTQIRPFFDALRADPEFSDLAGLPDLRLPAKFWRRLQEVVDRNVLLGLDVHHLWSRDEEQAAKLYFDAPIDRDGKPRSHFSILKSIGEKLLESHADFLAKAVEVTDSVALLHDSTLHVPSPLSEFGIDHVPFNSDWMGGLLGGLLQTGFNPRILHLNLTPESEIWENAAIFYQDNGMTNPTLSARVKKYVENGGIWINLLADSVGTRLGFPAGNAVSSKPASEETSFQYPLDQKAISFATPTQVLFQYPMPPKGCEPVLYSLNRVVGYRCRIGSGLYYQIGALIYSGFNSDRYAQMTETPYIRQFLEMLLTSPRVNNPAPLGSLTPAIRISGGGDRVVAFGRKDPKATWPDRLWITVKNGKPEPDSGRIQLQSLERTPSYSGEFRVTDLFSGYTQKLKTGSSAPFGQYHFDFELQPNGSTVYWVERMPSTR